MFHTTTFLLYASFLFLTVKDMMTSCLSLWSNLMSKITRISKHYLGLLELTEVGQQIIFAGVYILLVKKKKSLFLLLLQKYDSQLLFLLLFSSSEIN